MSRITASPFHKPSAFDFPRPVHPLSPPDTDPDSQGHMQASASTSYETRLNGLGTVIDKGHSSAAQSADSPTARFRKISSLAYQTSGLRDSSRDRSSHGAKWLVVVVPPASILPKHGHLGHTLSSGPSNRLAQGILMPLFPTMYGQLTAIQREFGLPSASGICLYLHITEGGVAMTPRVSDETWQLLWGHLLDERAAAFASKLPIGGQIEFDIDLHRARWYESWLAGARREDAAISVAPSFVPSHYRGDSRTTLAADLMVDEQADDASQGRTPMPNARHIPRKLSLLDRFDSSSIRSMSRRASRSPPEHPDVPVVRALSPVAQEDEPQTAKMHLEDVVKSWRAAASVVPTLSTITGQTSLDPVNMPNALPIEDLPASGGDGDAISELNLDDFAWSVSSAGPPSEFPDSPVSWGRVPSVHLARRLEGSVCLTPSTCTSFGPLGYHPDSPTSSMALLLSPDLGQRFVEDAPFTPMTATTWGAPSIWPDSPIVESRVDSVDLAERIEWSRPVTPATATSVKWPPSPPAQYSVHTPDVSHRSYDDSVHADVLTENDPSHVLAFPYCSAWEATPWNLVWPYASSTHAPWCRVWPYQRQASVEQAISARSPELIGPSVFVWPYYDRTVHARNNSSAFTQSPWCCVWPYQPQMTIEGVKAAQSPELIKSSGSAFVWPYYGPTVRARDNNPTRPGYPFFDIYTAVYPYFSLYPAAPSSLGTIPEAIPIRLPLQFPAILIHTSVYPDFEIYPGNLCVAQDARANPRLHADPTFELSLKSFRTKPFSARRSIADPVVPSHIAVKLPVTYSAFSLYPAPGYPMNLHEIYRATSLEYLYNNSTCVTLKALYPSFDLYPAVYPNVAPYPIVLKIDKSWSSLYTNASTGYPNFDLYSAESSINRSKDRFYYKSQPVYICASYPVFEIYPAVYPHIVPYPIQPEIENSVVVPLKQTITHPLDPVKSSLNLMKDTLFSKSQPVQFPTSYPTLNIYAAVYPWFNIYPTVRPDYYKETSMRPDVSFSPTSARSHKSNNNDMNRHSSSKLATRYHYSRRSSRGVPPVPLLPPNHQLLTPISPVSSLPLWEDAIRLISVKLEVSYPAFELYPVCYPNFVIYPSISGALQEPAPARQTADYPSFHLYPIVGLYSQSVSYPQFNIYPSLSPGGDGDETAIHLVACYPAFSLYTAIYPYFEIYPGMVCDGSLVSVDDTSLYPSFDIYHTGYPTKQENYSSVVVYPYFDIYHSGHTSTYDWPSLSVQLPVSYPSFSIYTPVYPYFELWSPPAVIGEERSRSSKSHRDLHLSVFQNTIVSAPSRTRRWHPKHTHADLHSAVMSVGLVAQQLASPPPTVLIDTTRRMTRSRSGTVNRTNMASSPSTASPGSRPLPTPPSASPAQSRRLSGLPTSPAEGRRTSVNRTAVFSSKSSLLLATVAEKSSAQTGVETASVLNRVRSMNDGIAPSATKSSAGLERASSLSRTVLKRDSSVSVRAKTYGGASDESSKLHMNKLSEFQMPPHPPLPTLPGGKPVAKLDRSKIPFA